MKKFSTAFIVVSLASLTLAAAALADPVRDRNRDHRRPPVGRPGGVVPVHPGPGRPVVVGPARPVPAVPPRVVRYRSPRGIVYHADMRVVRNHVWVGSVDLDFDYNGYDYKSRARHTNVIDRFDGFNDCGDREVIKNLSIEIERNDAQLYWVEVTFGNGDTVNLPVEGTYRRGEASDKIRTLDLMDAYESVYGGRETYGGYNQCIRSIEVSGETLERYSYRHRAPAYETRYRTETQTAYRDERRTEYRTETRTEYRNETRTSYRMENRPTGRYRFERRGGLNVRVPVMGQVRVPHTTTVRVPHLVTVRVPYTTTVRVPYTTTVQVPYQVRVEMARIEQEARVNVFADTISPLRRYR